jgi:myo-inositol catabolism protein IolC
MKNWSNSSLLILAFDHRGSFMSKMFGIEGREPTEEETQTISEYKNIVYQGFLKATETVGKDAAGILVDEQFGSSILKDAKEKGISFAMPCEKSGQDEFDFEYEDFQSHIENVNPTFTKVLVRLNPKGDNETNRIQLEKLKTLSDYLKSADKNFLFELLVPATEEQLASVSNDEERYDSELRPALMVEAMRIIQESGVEPDIWKLEGVDKEEDSRALVEQAKAEGRTSGVVTLGRGASKEKVAEWLKVGAHIPGVIGFAVGRTIFWDPLVGYKSNEYGKEEAIQKIANNYADFVKLWTDEKNE